MFRSSVLPQRDRPIRKPTPYDRLILDRHVRFVGDPVAIIAGEDEACVEKAMRLIKVKYEVLPAILDFHVAKDNEILIHPEDNWRSLCPVGADNQTESLRHSQIGRRRCGRCDGRM